MTPEPLTVSVVIATRDRPDLLPQAVRSAIDQTRAPLEVLVVDDGSTPAVRLPEPGNGSAPTVRLLRLDESSGPGAARNMACDQAEGALIAFLDDDDRWLPEKLERQVAALEANDAAAVVCGWELRDGDAVMRRCCPDPEDGLAYLEAPTVPPSILLVRADVLRAVGGFDPTLQFGEDWDLSVKLVEAHRVVALDEVLVHRSAHPHRRFGRQLLADHRRMTRRLAPRVRRLRPADRLRVRLQHLGRLGLYGSRVALEPILIGRLPWRLRHAWRRRLARSR